MGGGEGVVGCPGRPPLLFMRGDDLRALVKVMETVALCFSLNSLYLILPICLVFPVFKFFF